MQWQLLPALEQDGSRLCRRAKQTLGYVVYAWLLGSEVSKGGPFTSTLVTWWQPEGQRLGPKLSQSESLSTAPIERLHGVAGRIAKSRPLHQHDTFKVKVVCKRSAGIKLSLRKTASHKTTVFTRRTTFFSWFHHSSRDAN